MVDEYENGDSLEAEVAHDADRLKCMLQGLEYQERGYRNSQERVDTTRARLRTASAIQLADAAQGMSSAEWQRTYLGSNIRISLYGINRDPTALWGLAG